MQPTIPAMVAYAGPATVPIVKITTDLHSPRQNADAATYDFLDQPVYDTTRPSITALKKNVARAVVNTIQSTEKKPHRCYHDDCNTCGLSHNLHLHKCFIQPPSQDPPRTKEREESHPPPRLVYADIECLTDDERGFYPTLLCYQGEWQQTVTTLRDRDCDDGKTVVDVFLDHMMDFSYLATGPVEEQAHVILFHNLKGFDGVFILKALY